MSGLFCACAFCFSVCMYTFFSVSLCSQIPLFTSVSFAYTLVHVSVFACPLVCQCLGVHIYSCVSTVCLDFCIYSCVPLSQCSHLFLCASHVSGGGGRGGTAIYGYMGYIGMCPLWRVWFSSSLL